MRNANAVRLHRGENRREPALTSPVLSSLARHKFRRVISETGFCLKRFEPRMRKGGGVADGACLSSAQLTLGIKLNEQLTLKLHIKYLLYFPIRGNDSLPQNLA